MCEEGFFPGLNLTNQNTATARQTHSDSLSHLKSKAVGLRGARDKFPIDFTFPAVTGTHNAFVAQVFNPVGAVSNKHNNSVYVSQNKIQRYTVLCSPQAPSVCCCQSCAPLLCTS